MTQITSPETGHIRLLEVIKAGMVPEKPEPFGPEEDPEFRKERALHRYYNELYAKQFGKKIDREFTKDEKDVMQHLRTHVELGNLYDITRFRVAYDNLRTLAQ